MSKAKIIAVSAMCAAVVFGCLMLSTLPGLKWIMLILGVVASLAVVIPIMLDVKFLAYSLMTWFVGSVLGAFLGLANIVYVAPIICFCMPFAIVKVYGETVVVTASLDGEQVLEDPFGNGDDKKALTVQIKNKTKLHKAVRWVLYYVLLEVSMALTMLLAYLFTRPVFQTIISAKWFWWVVGAMQLSVYPYDFLMSGCLLGTAKILNRAVRK